jgi:hypothetical protein
MEHTVNPSYVGKLFPPYADEVTQLRSNSAGAKATKIIFNMLGAAIIVGIVWLIGALFEWKWVRYGGLAFGLYALISSLAKIFKSQCAACPYCHRDVGSGGLEVLSPSDQNLQFACQSCFEWLISNKGQVRAFRETDVGNRKEFDCPVIANGVWPDECIVCGAPPTRHRNARTVNLALGALLIGKIGVSFGSVKNIPYCDTHDGAISVKKSEGKIWADFNDYSARRRYLYANRLYRLRETNRGK